MSEPARIAERAGPSPMRAEGWIPRSAATDWSLGKRELQLLVLVAAFSGRDHVARVAAARLADEMSVSRATVQRGLRRLERAGYLERRHQIRVEGGYALNEYVVLPKARGDAGG